MFEKELNFLFRDVMRKGHQTLSEYKLDDSLAHLYANDYNAYKKAIISGSNGNAIVHV